MDRNTVIGFVLIGALLIGMFYINSKSSQAQQALVAQQNKTRDSLAAIKAKSDTTATKLEARKLDSLQNAQKQLPQTYQTATTEQLTTIENDVLRVTFTNKGAQPKTVELKTFKTFDGKPLYLQSGNFNKLSYKINAGGAKETSDILFVKGAVKMNADSSQTIMYSIKDSAGSKDLLVHEFTLPAPHKDGYMLDFNITMNGADMVTQNSMNLLWQTEMPQVEKTITYEKTQTHLCYLENGKYDFHQLGSGGDEKLDKQVSWLAVNPQFFVATLLAKNKFENAELRWVTPADSLKIIAQSSAQCRINVPSNGIIPLQLYYGPNDYNILDKYNNDMHQIVTYGSGPFSFVKYINRHFLLPVWDFIRSHVASYGIVILLLTLLIRLITSPILYKSYLSGAKMKLLKPEVDALKLKFTDKSGTMDQQAFSMEQMKLWKSAGVSPLGGCLPALLQIPIFMSLYYFFQSNIALRGQSFLWSKDLAAYDSILNFGNIPVISSLYGDHVSLFTITATLTSLLISIYSMSNMQDNTNPVMKYMPYIFPVLLLGVFNKLPSALTWYYTVSNTITLLLQIIIQKYIIDHDKILAQISENRKKPVKQSKLQERIAAMQESQKKMQEQKNKNGRK
ncbi:membrane protein insertase YidC [Ferruginibacter sp. SUN106]|uniref:membrane protein insertase YidC n=1 Tax=Ferruginibacter sp. SUN106 TaxID=2978348 RepID=UPI003D36DDCA